MSQYLNCIYRITLDIINFMTADLISFPSYTKSEKMTPKTRAGPTYRQVITYYSRIDKEWFEMSFKPRGIWCWNNWRFNFELESAGWSSSNSKREKRRFGVGCKNFITRISKKWWRRRATGYFEWLPWIHESTKSEFNPRYFLDFKGRGSEIII